MTALAKLIWSFITLVIAYAVFVLSVGVIARTTFELLRVGWNIAVS